MNVMEQSRVKHFNHAWLSLVAPAASFMPNNWLVTCDHIYAGLKQQGHNNLTLLKFTLRVPSCQTLPSLLQRFVIHLEMVNVKIDHNALCCNVSFEH